MGFSWWQLQQGNEETLSSYSKRNWSVLQLPGEHCRCCSTAPGCPMDRWGDVEAFQVRDSPTGPWDQSCRAATLRQPREPQISSQRGENCSFRTWKSGLEGGRGDLPSMVIQGPTALPFPFNTLHLSNTQLEHGKFWGFNLIFQSVVYSPHVSTVCSAQLGGWGGSVDGNSSGKELNPSSAHVQPHSKSLKAGCSSQPLLVCSLTFSSSCLSLLHPGNSEVAQSPKSSLPR